MSEPIVQRPEDMSPTGHLTLLQQEDGDMIISIRDEDGKVASVEFCTPVMGGGKSPATIRALRDLAKAMAEDNRDHPVPSRVEWKGEAFLGSVPPLGESYDMGRRSE